MPKIVLFAFSGLLAFIIDYLLFTIFCLLIAGGELYLINRLISLTAGVLVTYCFNSLITFRENFIKRNNLKDELINLKRFIKYLISQSLGFFTNFMIFLLMTNFYKIKPNISIIIATLIASLINFRTAKFVLVRNK